MEGKSKTLRGWPAARMFLMLAVTPVLTALVMSLPVAWLINDVFGINAIRAVFGIEHFGYWRAVGMFALWYTTRIKVKLDGPSEQNLRAEHHRCGRKHNCSDEYADWLLSQRRPVSSEIDLDKGGPEMGTENRSAPSTQKTWRG